MAFTIQKAKREQIWVKVALMAASGGGKTYSALRLATGMRKKLKELGIETRILMANTEASRGKYYANEFDYDIVDVAAPHNPEKYVELIEFAQAEGYKILIIDSSSHEWEGKGGCLELHQLAGGTYQSWAKVTPRHEKFIQKIADSEMHIIATMRGKDAYEMEKTDNGKTTVKKLGIGAKQRDGFEFEFTVTFSIDQKSNMAVHQKDNTHIFEDEGEVLLSESFGEKIIAWANSGEAAYTRPVREEETIQSVKDAVIAKCVSLGGRDNTELMTVLKMYEKNGNPNSIKDLEKMKELLSKLEDVQPITKPE